MQEVQSEIVSSTKIREAISEGYIQRANAYLDHYYIIIGNPVQSTDNCFGSAIPVTYLPISEETKLTPASGVYAVTAAGEAFYSKAMAIVDNALPKESRVAVHFFDFDKTVPGKNITLFFHKKIRDLSQIVSQGKAAANIKGAFEEINELIF